jgi:uncharacterized membrane protein (UPF0182 family)
LFFNRDAAWSVAQAPADAPESSTGGVISATGATAIAGVDSINATDSDVERFSPYYSIFHAPNAKTDIGVFAMIRPFVPFSADDSRKELRSLMVVSSDPKTYGRMTVYDISAPLPPGPATVSAEFESEPSISQTITPLDQRGSRVTYGDLQLVPVGKGIVYLRPMFVQPDGQDKQVFVRKVLGSYDGRSVIGDSLTSVIQQLFPGFNMDLGDRVGGTTGVTTTTLPGSSSPVIASGRVIVCSGRCCTCQDSARFRDVPTKTATSTCPSATSTCSSEVVSFDAIVCLQEPQGPA